jgi:hypothetical protein
MKKLLTSLLLVSSILTNGSVMATAKAETSDDTDSKNQLMVISHFVDVNTKNSEYLLERALLQCYYNFYAECYRDVKILWLRYMLTVPEQKRGIEQEKYERVISKHLKLFFETK